MNARLFDADGRFGDVEYILSMQYALESKQISDSIGLVMKKRKAKGKSGRRLSAGMLKDLSNVCNMLTTDLVFQLLKQIRGSPPYWHIMFFDALAMIRQLGIPTWFKTESAADLRWPDVIQSIAAQYGTIYTDEQVKELSWEQRTLWIRTNPVTAARQFQFRLETYFTEFLKSKACPIGPIIDFLIRIEFQARGSPHCHSLIWIKDAPKLGISTDEEVIAFIDKYVSCAIPDDDEELRELVITLQTHSHSSYCRRDGRCRFGVPKPPSLRTLIAREATGEHAKQDIEFACQTLSTVREVLDNKENPDDMTLEDVLEEANISLENYEKALSTTKSGESIILKRKPIEKRTNQYNPAIMKAWEANTDMQYITNAFACVMYIASYVLKPEKGMGELLKRAAKEMENADIQQQLRKLGSVFLTHREVSAQEAVYRANSMPLKKSSRKVIFINTDTKEDRVSLVLPSSRLSELEDDDEDVFAKNCIDRYAARPDELENLTLAEFVADWTLSYGKAAEEKKEDNNTLSPEILENPDDTLPTKLMLKDGLGMISKRRTRAVIRWHRFNEEKEPEKHYRAKLMLYLPWRDEEALMADYLSYEDRYDAEEEAIKLKEAEFVHNANQIDEAYELLQQHGPPEHAWEDVAPGTEEQEAAAEEEGTTEERPLDDEDIEANANLFKKGQQNNEPRSERLHNLFTKEANKDILTPQQYNQFFRMLNKEQKQIIMYHRRWCKEVVVCHKQGKPTKPYFLFLSGPGGVGKSFVIKMIHTDTVKILRNSPLIGSKDLTCLLTASSGVASFNIEGSTVHSALALRVRRKGNDTHHHGLPQEIKNTLENDLEHLQVLIIDEISMIGANTLYQVHRNLEEIKNRLPWEDTRFGNTTVIGIGDHYQLPAFKDHKVFEAAGSPDSDTPVFLHGSIWKENFKLHELTQVMRQRDQEFATLLSTIRTGEKLSKQQIDMLESRCTTLDDPNHFKEALHVYAKNQQANEYNTQMLAELPGEEFTCEAIIDKRDNRTNQITVDFSTSKRTDTGGLDTIVKFKRGATMRMVANLNVADGLANGAMGIVKDVIYHVDRKSRKKVDCVLFRFFDPRVGTEAKASSPFKSRYPDCVPVYMHTTTFFYKSTAEFMITGLPLTLSFASTIHAVQGLTLNKIVVDMKGLFAKGQAYVALSRVRTLEGLQILNFRTSSFKTNPVADKEMERMRTNTIQNEIPECMVSSLNDQWFKVAHLNVRNYLSHYEDVKLTDGFQVCDIICFTETHLKPSMEIPLEKQPRPELIPFRFDRKGPIEKGGILIYAHPKYSPARLTDIRVDGLEFGAITVQPGVCDYSSQTLPDKMNIITIYRRKDGSNKEEFLGRMQLFLEHPKITDANTPSLILGDFNEDLMTGSSKRIPPFMEQFGFNLVTGLNCKQQVPTTNIGSCIDHIYTNIKPELMRLFLYEVFDTYYSDHDVTYVAIGKATTFRMESDLILPPKIPAN